MAKKYIDIMDTTFRDGFQSVFGARVAMDDFLPAVSAAREAGISHFEFGGGARFQSLFFYLKILNLINIFSYFPFLSQSIISTFLSFYIIR